MKFFWVKCLLNWYCSSATKKDEEREANSKLKEVSVAEILEAQREEQTVKEEEEKVKTKARMKRGLPVNASDTYLNSDDMFG